MTSRFGITEAAVRLKLGIESSDISDANVLTFIEEAEYEAEQVLKTKFTPTRAIERYEMPNPKESIVLRHTPVARIANILVGGTAGKYVDMDDVLLRLKTGKLQLKSGAEVPEFDSNVEKVNVIDYYYARMEETSTETSTSAATGTGTSVSFSVGTDVGYAVADNVLISGIDGKEEITTLTGTGNGASTLTGPLMYNHISGSRVVKMQIPRLANELTQILAAIRCALNMIGATYTFATSYSVPEHSVTKGVPYPHFVRALDGLIERRDWIIGRYRPTWAIG